MEDFFSHFQIMYICSNVYWTKHVMQLPFKMEKRSAQLVWNCKFIYPAPFLIYSRMYNIILYIFAFMQHLIMYLPNMYLVFLCSNFTLIYEKYTAARPGFDRTANLRLRLRSREGAQTRMPHGEWIECSFLEY